MLVNNRRRSSAISNLSKLLSPILRDWNNPYDYKADHLSNTSSHLSRFFETCRSRFHPAKRWLSSVPQDVEVRLSCSHPSAFFIISIESTTIQLIQRFYDPDHGRILIDGRDIKTLNVAWLRSHIGIVSQEPVLFTGSIEENIRFGKSDATDEEVQAAAKMANAHEFIMALPEVGLPLSLSVRMDESFSFVCRTTRHRRVRSSVVDKNNEVGDRRLIERNDEVVAVAIARALISNPTILLLDEATSALGKWCAEMWSSEREICVDLR